MGRQRRVDLAAADGHDRYVPTGRRDLLSAGHEGVYQWAVEHLVEEGMKLLDLGCGTGYGAAMVTAAGAAFDGVDASGAAIAHAQANYSAPGARFFVADLMQRPPKEFVPRSYDVVFSSEVLEHVSNPFDLVRWMSRFVRDDGVCFVGTPNRSWSHAHMPGGHLMAPSHLMEFTAAALASLLQTAFHEVEVMFRVFPAQAIRSAIVPPHRPPLVRGALAFAREVAPGTLKRYREHLETRRHGAGWSPQDIEWLAWDEPGADPSRCVGLAAVCRNPRRPPRQQAERFRAE